MPKLLTNSSTSKFMSKKWIDVNDLSSDQYSVNKKIKFKTWMLRSHFCDYCNACFVVKRRVSVAGTDNDNRRKKR